MLKIAKEVLTENTTVNLYILSFLIFDFYFCKMVSLIYLYLNLRNYNFYLSVNGLITTECQEMTLSTEQNPIQFKSQLL